MYSVWCNTQPWICVWNYLCLLRRINMATWHKPLMFCFQETKNLPYIGEFMCDTVPLMRVNTFCSLVALLSNKAIACITVSHILLHVPFPSGDFSSHIFFKVLSWQYQRGDLAYFKLQYLWKMHCVNFSTLCWLYLRDSYNKGFRLLFEQSWHPYARYGQVQNHPVWRFLHHPRIHLLVWCLGAV